MGLAAVYAALTESNTAARGLSAIESALIALLLFETLMHRITRHIMSELPMAGDVVADCLRLVARLYVIILIADALMVRVLGAMTPEEWLPHDRGAKVAALSAVAIYAFWRFVKFRMDSYIAANPLPSADVAADAEDDGKVAASRLRTLMPLLRAIAGSVIVVVGGLLVLSELGVNITPLIAGASVLGLAVSFGSQSLVRDIVSGMFFLAEDSFRIGEYVDCSKVKGTVEGFSVRSLKLQAPERPAPHRAVRPGRPHHQLQPRLDGGEVQPRLRPRHRRRAAAQDGEEDRPRHDGGAHLQADPDAAAQDAGRGRHQGQRADRALQVHGAAQEPQPGPAHGDPPHVRELPGARHPVRHAELSVCHGRPPVAPSPPAVAPPVAPSPAAAAPEATLPPPAPAKAAE